MNYLNLDVIKTEDLPCYRKKKVVYVKENVAFITSWLQEKLKEFFKEKQTFLHYSAETVTPLDFKLTLNDEKKELEVKLQFLVDEEKTELELKGQLHRSDKEKVGVEWIKVDGPDFWLSSIASSLNESLDSIA